MGLKAKKKKKISILVTLVALKHPRCFRMLDGWVAKAQFSVWREKGKKQTRTKTQDVTLATPTTGVIEARNGLEEE